MSLYVNLLGCNISEWLIPNNVTGYSVKVRNIQLYHFDETKYFTGVSYIFVDIQDESRKPVVCLYLLWCFKLVVILGEVQQSMST